MKVSFCRKCSVSIEKCIFVKCATETIVKTSKGRLIMTEEVFRVAMLKITRQLGCVFQDMEPPMS